MKDYKKIITDIIYPPVCPVCGDVIPIAKRKPRYEGKPCYGAFLCAPCKGNLRFLEGNVCEKCGAETSPGKTLCNVCEEVARCFAGGKSILAYDGVARQMMMAFKYSGKREYADFLTYAAAERAGSWIQSLHLDAIVPVPIHPEKRKARGYNQAELLAQGIAAYTGVPMRDILKRNKETNASKELGLHSRVFNLRDAFSLKGPIPKGKRFLLVDDILTTGVTMESCAELLLYEGNADAVYVLSLCSGK